MRRRRSSVYRSSASQREESAKSPPVRLCGLRPVLPRVPRGQLYFHGSKRRRNRGNYVERFNETAPPAGHVGESAAVPEETRNRDSLKISGTLTLAGMLSPLITITATQSQLIIERSQPGQHQRENNSSRTG